VRILSDDQVRVQRHRLADVRQAVKRGHRDLDLIANAIYIKHQMRRLFLSQKAA
jgi:hypothetical protein